MSAKWRALQHRHRYTYSSVAFPEPFFKTLVLLETSAAITTGTTPSSSYSPAKFLADLKNLTSLDSTYTQIAAAKDLSSSFSDLLGHAGDLPKELVSAAARLYLEILFLDNSLPLHRTLISAIAKSRKSLPVVESCLLSLCGEYGELGRQGKKRFLASRAALSLMSYPKLGFLNDTVEKCAVPVALDIAVGLAGVISDVGHGSRPSPAVMEQCQDAMSCLYYLLQRFPSKFVRSDEQEGLSTFESVVEAILSVLKSSAFSRDCLVAAGVSFCAALQACLRPQELASFIAQGFFGFDCDGKVGLDAMKVLPEVDLYTEIREFSVSSRICLVRGMLTAVPRTVLNFHFVGSGGGGSVWTILYNGILPELCDYCENPSDSHFNFHALTVTQICLQQIKTSILADLTDFSRDYDPFPESIMSRLLRTIWNNLEDPLNQTVKQVHLIFDLFLDIRSTVPAGNDNERNKLFLFKITSDLLRLGSRCKGRYVPLASLTRRLSAKTLLDMNPNLLFETANAYVDDDVCCAVTTFLKCFLECLRDECWSSDGIEQGYATFRGLCLPPIMQGLISGHSKLRSNLNTYALPVVLGVDVDIIFPMLAAISVGPNEEENKIHHMDITIEQCVAALVSLLKVSRLHALVEGDIDWDHSSAMDNKSSDCIARACVKGINVKVPVGWFVQALVHIDDNIRIDAAETLFLNPKTSSLPSPLELSLMREVLPLNMRCCSTAFQMKWTSLFRKFFSRVRTALERQVKQGCWQPSSCSNRNENGCADDIKEVIILRSRELFCFMKWLSCFLFYSCYPSAPYERKTMAMELILIMIDVWPIVPPSRGSGYLYPYSEEFTSPDSTLSLVGSIIDSWDKLRESSFRILLCFPSPLPGVSSYDSVMEVIRWAKKLVCSPRVRESDAGALALRLIFRKYVLELGWVVGASVNVICFDSQYEVTGGDSQIHKLRFSAVDYISSLIDWLRIAVEDGEKDLSEACRNSFVHGVLLTLRYTFEDLDWNSVVVSSCSSEMRCALEKLLELVMRITSLALWVVSADAWYLPDDTDDLVDDVAFLSDVQMEMDPQSLLETMDTNPESAENVQPAQQVVMVGCWLAMKEVSLLLGTIIRKIPLPSLSEPGYPPGNTGEVQTMALSDIILDFKQLETIGNHFLQVLLKMKHNGAIDKTRAGFTALCNRLLCSNDPRLCKMTESWMEQLMERTTAKGQTVDDLLRRSAGIPAAFTAFFLSEPEGTPKKLLPRALQWLIDVAKVSLPGAGEAFNLNNRMTQKNFSEKLNQAPLQSLGMESDVSVKASKVRDEGVIPTVHAFNVLKAAFNDTNLATDTSGFAAEALIISIRSFSSPYWEVRNSACLAYTALVRRMIGFLNVQKRESARRALTGLEFFHRYPALHTFLFEELKIATELLGDGSSKHSESNIAKAIHPSLCPILILLSRLKPSLVSSDTNDALDPFSFMPFIRKCATQSNLRVRVLSSRALTGLVSNEKLTTVFSGVVLGLPSGRSQMTLPETVHTIHSRSINGSNDDETLATCSVSFNAIHGTLLQLSSLLNTNCRDLTDVSKKDRILGELIQALWKCSWIGSMKSCPCPTLSSSFLQVLDHMLDIARTCNISGHVYSIQSMLLTLSSECLDREKSHGTFYDPTEAELRKQAATSFFRCLFGANQEVSRESPLLQKLVPHVSNSDKMSANGNTIIELQERIRFCISDTTYEVRLATLKWLLHFLKSSKSGDNTGIIHLWASTNLQATLMQLLAIEENPKCIYYILRIIFSWNLHQFDTHKNLQSNKTIYMGIMDCDSVFGFWKRLVSLSSIVTRSKTRETFMCCMGLCVKQFSILFRRSLATHLSQVEEETTDRSGRSDQFERWAEVYGCIDTFVLLVKHHSASSEPVNMRKAAAESMVASGLLEEAVFVASHVSDNQNPYEELHICKINDKKGSNLELPKLINLYACRILDLWFTCIQLLEDEDVGLRQRLAKDVQSCINNSETSRGRLFTHTVPTQVEKVIESSFEFLTAIFGHWLEYVNHLLKWVLHSASYQIAHGDLVRRVFDKEIDNHHEEKLLICQICCSHLEKLASSPYWALAQNPQDSSCKCNFSTFLQSWRERFLHQVLSFANEYVEAEGRADWIGGIGNHKDAFVPVYANLLGLYVLLRCPSDGGFYSQEELTEIYKLMSLDFVKLGEIIKPFIRNPLISNMYSSVIQTHEKMLLGDSVCHSELISSGGCSVWKDFDPYFLLK
uniref:Thyroid adenoma associated protein n=1 Tax=Symplocarpus renifolius TaxID=477955 RepID=A0A8D5SDA3_9ARAE|nr:thyroid adenoma associated protein [Symplocarpus renifolius]